MAGRWLCLVVALVSAGCTRPNPNYCPAGAGKCEDAGDIGDGKGAEQGSDAGADDASLACVPELLFIRGNGFDTSVVRIDLQSFVETPISNGVDQDFNAEWSPDGSRIALIRNGTSVWTVSGNDGSDAHQITSGSDVLQYIAWSPDGTRVLYTDLQASPVAIFSAAVEGSGSPARLNPAQDGRGPVHWSSDGSKIVFMSNRTGNLDVFVMDKDGGNQTNVTNRSGDDTSPIWSPDGADIALVYQSSIWLIAPDGSNVRNLNGVSSTFYGEPNWSYDSNQIFFVKSPTAGSEIYVMNRTGANQHSIDTSIELDNQPTPSPDGTKVAWVSNRDGNAEIYVSNIDGTQPTRVTNNDTKDTFPRWRPCAH
ncbi:MAG TPA: hypothetical protein VGM39_26150 [Kofleriaceae bacterium]